MFFWEKVPMEASQMGGGRIASGRFGDSLASFDAIELDSIVIRELVARTNIEDQRIDEVIMGNFLPVDLEQSTADNLHSEKPPRTCSCFFDKQGL